MKISWKQVLTALILSLTFVLMFSACADGVGEFSTVGSDQNTESVSSENETEVTDPADSNNSTEGTSSEEGDKISEETTLPQNTETETEKGGIELPDDTFS